VSYLEGGVIFFTLLAILMFWKFMNERRFWFLFGLCFGLALLSKFITFFLVPAFIFTIFFTERSLFRKRELYLSFGLAFLVNAPTIIYNIFM
jgi:4-amino-4-deoxy-L-arabinose transferase-like glycosyltransferase